MSIDVPNAPRMGWRSNLGRGRAKPPCSLKALAWANYKGEIALRVPVPGMGLMKRIKAVLGPLYSAVCSSTRN